MLMRRGTYEIVTNVKDVKDVLANRPPFLYRSAFVRYTILGGVKTLRLTDHITRIYT